MIGDADMPRKVIDAPGDMHVRHRHDLAILRVLHQEQIVAARGFAQRRAQLLEQLHRAHDRCQATQRSLRPSRSSTASNSRDTTYA